MKNFCFDIETIPVDTERLNAIIPPFNADEVRVGNLTDPEKIAAKIERARTEHFQRYYKRAALSALTGSIAMIGVLGASDGDPIIFVGPNEAETITAFFEFWLYHTNEGAHWLGFNIKNFDVPFLVRRAWLHKIPVAPGFVKGRYLPAFFTDLMELWTGPEHAAQFEVSLNDLALYFGFEPKTANGADFHELLRYKPDEARDYLRHDLRLTYRIAEAMHALKYPTPASVAQPAPAPEPEPEPKLEPVEEKQLIKFY